MFGFGDFPDAVVMLPKAYYPIILLVKVFSSEKKNHPVSVLLQIFQEWLTSLKTEFFLTLGKKWPLNSFKRPSSSLSDGFAHSRPMHPLLLGML
uniref:Uncharacterized protein n=1 Tax=Lepeophtheirus salmonis TaxID=72036 RepID=A0A0K2SZF3_LEPSM